MSEHGNEKIRATIHIPDPFTGTHFEAFARVGRENGEMAVANAKYLKALAVLEKAEIEVGGKTLHLDDLKSLGLDADLSIIVWVGTTVNDVVNDQFDIAKNSSEPPSKPPTAAEKKGQ